MNDLSRARRIWKRDESPSFLRRHTKIRMHVGFSESAGFIGGLGLIFAITALGGMAASALGQAPLHADSATQPSPGHFTLREQFRYSHFEDDRTPRRKTDDFVALTWLEYGVSPSVALSLRTPLSFRWQETDGRVGHDESVGIDDITLMLKWRFYKNDSGPLDTARLSLLAGGEIRSGDSPFSSGSYDPILGLAFTKVSGRHGVNLATQWEFTTDGGRDPLYPGESKADLLRYDAAYVYRIRPVEFSADSHGALYGLVEMNGLYETNGDHEVLLSPCLMYEARSWTFELGIQLPAIQELDHRPETRYVLVMGLRFAL